MIYLEKDIVSKASTYKIPLYEPEDLAQEMRFSVWKGLASWRGESSLRTWANRVITMRAYELNRFQTRTKKRKDHLFRPFEDYDEMHLLY